VSVGPFGSVPPASTTRRTSTVVVDVPHVPQRMSRKVVCFFSFPDIQQASRYHVPMKTFVIILNVSGSHFKLAVAAILSMQWQPF
jgi:hypothetical protein